MVITLLSMQHTGAETTNLGENDKEQKSVENKTEL